MAKTRHNFWWTIGILAAANIALASFILSDRVADAAKIMEFISYSSALLSITLSVFAIQYTYTSNVQIQQQFDKINSVAENIRGTSNMLNRTSGSLDKNLKEILSHLESIDRSQQEIYSTLDNSKSKSINTELSNIKP